MPKRSKGSEDCLWNWLNAQEKLFALTEEGFLNVFGSSIILIDYVDCGECREVILQCKGRLQCECVCI